MLIEIISHCWAAGNPHFAGALRYQISSLVLHKPKTCDVRLTACLDTFDTKALVAANWGRYHLGIDIRPLMLSRPMMTRRCIGRNIAALESKADLIWFSDVDQVYYKGLLDRLADLPWDDDWQMIFPREIQIHRDHRLGDSRLLSAATSTDLIDIDPIEFVPHHYNRAIGGVQIVRGDFAREHGYLDGHPKWGQPRADGLVLGDFIDDRQYRGFVARHGRIVGVDLSGLYRLRHTRTSYQEPKI